MWVLLVAAAATAAPSMERIVTGGPGQPAGDRSVELTIEPSARRATDDQVAAWVRDEVAAVTAYLGRFPVPVAALTVVPVPGHRIDGDASGAGSVAMTLALGEALEGPELRRQWVLVHELTHLALPRVERRHHWLEEGFATYVEPLVRAQSGEIQPPEVWSQLIEGLPHGLPGPRDPGLDARSGWGPTYWGGALFWLLADLEIRLGTAGRCSIQDALKGIGTAGGSLAVSWTLQRIFEVGDRAVGVPVLEQLYDKMGPRPMAIDLPALFKRLGVAEVKGKVVFDDTAPDANVRRAVTDRSSGSCKKSR
jgi:hypothetical protein